MVKRYYCDYCDRSFPYSVEARKKHINGYQHQKLRTLHYNQYKTAKEKLQEESGKEKCRRFYSGQECSFGDACIYSHLTTGDLNKLREEVYQENEAKRSSKLLSEGRNSSEPSLEKWISKTLTGGDSATKFNIHDETELEVLFKNRSLASLPPSLILPTPESLLDCNFQDWG
ncbi:zinc finger matrin-type protein 5-like [Penaeus japonicus]|uniref:zinc finger matrin-type protein 5-like n=1 Tax=Penaeus japonicus TaxID=27405 RepID=UPI001C713F9C|nr:zinc finger matrin-type protein 5-like [Penaeus japonicus]XP_042881657.1 zinc finger matrin-type protein 5-like [Penaeus japonicus]XP_042881658.1 zinc finger matrin-type protein 5-like [Penaeus japonicus]XP_042881659.1 zinc finger matrin-type protein 5-like [Penaeus japonicus]